MLEIKHSKNISGHPATRLLAQGMADAAAFGSDGIALHWEQSVFHIEDDDGVPISALAYRLLPDRNCYWVCMGATAEGHRRAGHYSRLYQALMERAADKDIRTVEGEVANENLVMMAAAKAQGRFAKSTRWVSKVGE